MKASEVRRKYVEFFREKGHDIVPSASLVPHDDPSLLWVNSGMAPLKKYFDGRVVPANPRLTNSQKCIRTNDIENVGKTARHHTFFEMLGNFSIGDYFKREAIHWAWEFVTDWLGLDKALLSVTIHPEDDEAFSIWHREIGLSEEKILRLEENFWDIGEGPCGPNSEIFYDRGPGVGCGRPECDASCDCDRHLEIWNLVFSQYNHNPDGSYTPLPKKNIDTGMGLERTASVLQGVATNFDTDLFIPIMNAAAAEANVRYGQNADVDVALKVIADHVRAVTFAVTDGVPPGNEGRGYVIRRLLRRAARYGKRIGVERPFLHTLVQVVGDVMGDYYPEVVERRDYVAKIIRLEEERFLETLADGEALLARLIHQVKSAGSDTLPGAEAFKLYDTYGFPLDLTEEIAAESGLAIDRVGFDAALELQRERARSARQETTSMQVQSGTLRDYTAHSEFVGYETLHANGHVQAIVRDDELVPRADLGDRIQVLLDRTPFYAESGGQVADVGMLLGDGVRLRVLDVQKAPNGQHVHTCEVAEGGLSVGVLIEAVVAAERRKSITKNHTATHLLHKALREVLGEHVAQAGSLVAPDRLRFDFSHFGALTRPELDLIERKVNEAVWRDDSVSTEIMNVETAKASGAMALFGEKYGEIVRVVRAGTSSTELCGGCHVERTGQIGLFKLVGETGIGSGVRRIEAVTGESAYDFVKAEEQLLAAVADQLRASPQQLSDRVDAMVEEFRGLGKEIEGLRNKLSVLEAARLLDRIEERGGERYLIAQVPDMDVEGLRVVVDQIRQRQQDVLVALASAREGKASFVVAVPERLQRLGLHAGKIVKEIAAAAGGSGGGRPDIAQAGAKEPERIPAALEVARRVAHAALQV